METLSVAPSRHVIALDGAEIELYRGGAPEGGLTIAAAHPADPFNAGTVALLSEVTGAEVVCVNPRGLGGSVPDQPGSFEQMVDDIEAVRRKLGLGRWVFWGMSGGGWVTLLYAHRYPEAVAAIVVESVCACFRVRLADPSCVLSPQFAAWREPLRAHGLFDPDAHTQPSAGDDTEWVEIDGVGTVFRRRGGPALLVSPAPVGAGMRRAMPALWGFDARPWLASLQVPALVVGGTEDPVTPLSHVRALHQSIAGSTLVTIAGASHVPTTSHQFEVARGFRAFVAAHPGLRP